MTNTAAAILNRASLLELASAYRLAAKFSPTLAAAILVESRRRAFPGA